MSFKMEFTGTVVAWRDDAITTNGAEWSLAILADGVGEPDAGVAVLYVSGARYIMPEEVAADMVGKWYLIECDDVGLQVMMSDMEAVVETIFHASKIKAL